MEGCGLAVGGFELDLEPYPFQWYFGYVFPDVLEALVEITHGIRNPSIHPLASSELNPYHITSPGVYRATNGWPSVKKKTGAHVISLFSPPTHAGSCDSALPMKFEGVIHEVKSLRFDARSRRGVFFFFLALSLFFAPFEGPGDF